MGNEFEYPDEAGYPDGMGSLHEGVDDADTGADDTGADPVETELDDFALQDEEDVDGD